jgi:N-acetylglucosaminyldiphosphoundecaprenol N-acetyl-beta-D-mannosaminyltransferase
MSHEPARASEVRARTVRVGTVDVADVTAAELIQVISSAVDEGRGLRILYANAHAIRLAADDPTFHRHLAHADLLCCDGRGVKLAARLLGSPLRAGLTPPEWIGALIEHLGMRARLYLVGDEPAVVTDAADVLQREHPACTVVGKHHGFFPMSGADNERLLEDITLAAPTVILVGMGMPRQERWAHLVAERVPTAVVIAVGALFRRLTGIEPRPPRWIRAAGFEWLVRLVRHPVRMFDRYVIGLPKFGLIVAHEWYRSHRR